MTVDQALPAVLVTAAEARSWQEPLYRDLHQNPELSHAEHRTAAIVADRLRQSGYQVTEGVGGTGVVGILRNGTGPTVLLRADMDALPVQEATGLPYASTVLAPAPDADGQVPVAHACGHDMHTACLLGAAHLLALGQKHWGGTLVALFQPAEETVDGARGMVDDGLAQLLPPVDVVLGQHVAPLPAGYVGAQAGPAFAAADCIRVTVYGRGGHASRPETTVDPVVLAASIVLRLQTVVAREVEPGEPAVLTVGSLHAGTKANIIADHAVLELNIRTYSKGVRSAILAAIQRIVTAECAASGSPRDPEFEFYEHAPLTDNDPGVTAKLIDTFTGVFADRVVVPPRVLGSEDFSDIARGVSAPYSYWLFGGTDPEVFAKAAAAARRFSPSGSCKRSSVSPIVNSRSASGKRKAAMVSSKSRDQA